MKKGKTKQIASIFIVLALSFGAIQALSTPVFGTIAVRMSNDKTINTSIAVLESNLEDLKIVDYNTFEFAIEISRIVGPVIWVGHGNPDGIETADTSISWDDFSSNIRRTAASDYVLSCYSSSLIEQTTLDHNDALTFEGEVDSTLGALIVSYYCNPSLSIAQDALSHISALQNKRVAYTPLPFVLDPGEGGGGGGTPPPPPSVVWENPNIPGAGFTAGEIALHAIIIFLLLLSIFSVGYAAYVGCVITTAFLIATASLASFIVTALIVFQDWFNGDSSNLEFVGDLLNLIPAVFTVYAATIILLDAAAAVLAAIIFGVEIAVKATIGVAVWIAMIAALIAAILYEIDNALKDWID